MRYATCLLLLLACPAFSAEPVYTWRSRADDPDRIYLYRDGKQIGGWCYRAKHYRPFNGETWGSPSDASPVQPPERGRPAPLISWESPPHAKSVRSRARAWISQAAAAGALVDALNQWSKAFEDSLYLWDLVLSAELAAHIDMGAKLNDKTDSEAYRAAKELMTKGSARLFLSERAKFAKKLREEKFSNPVLAMIFLEIEDDNQASIGIGAHPEDKFQSRLLFRGRDWGENARTTIGAHTAAVLLFVNRKTKVGKEKIPVTVRCSFVFMALKEGGAFIKTLYFDLYLEKLEKKEGLYPWKIRNVQYK